MKLTTATVHVSNKNISIEIPALCPVCGVGNNPTTSSAGYYATVYSFVHTCNVCKNWHYTLQLIESSIGKLLAVYPEHQPSELPNLVIEHFSRFTKMYRDAEQAEQNDAVDLAAIGYRASLEILIKDYALEFGLDTKEYIAKLNLNSAIAHYFKDNFPIFKTVEVVRILGNDYAHWEQVETVGLDIMKGYLDIFISFIKTQLMMKYPPVSR